MSSIEFRGKIFDFLCDLNAFWQDSTREDIEDLCGYIQNDLDDLFNMLPNLDE